MNFEKALHDLFVSIFPYSETVGGVFHLGQSCWRKISVLGKSLRYHTDDSFQFKMKCFGASACFPIENVVNVFVNLSDNEDIPSEFTTYFETTYIGIRRRRETPTVSYSTLQLFYNNIRQSPPHSHHPISNPNSALSSIYIEITYSTNTIIIVYKYLYFQYP